MGTMNFYNVMKQFDSQELNGLAAVCAEMAEEDLKEANGFFQSIMDGFRKMGKSGGKLAEKMDEYLTATKVTYLDTGFANGAFCERKFKVSDPEALAVLSHIKEVTQEKKTFKFSPEAA